MSGFSFLILHLTFKYLICQYSYISARWKSSVKLNSFFPCSALTRVDCYSWFKSWNSTSWWPSGSFKQNLVVLSYMFIDLQSHVRGSFKILILFPTVLYFCQYLIAGAFGIDMLCNKKGNVRWREFGNTKAQYVTSFSFANFLSSTLKNICSFVVCLNWVLWNIFKKPSFR